jgi:hypothetical protein
MVSVTLSGEGQGWSSLFLSPRAPDIQEKRVEGCLPPRPLPPRPIHLPIHSPTHPSTYLFIHPSTHSSI